MPAIISWPGHLPENEVRSQFATGCDWYPTVLELCGLPAAAHALDGRSLVPVIRSGKAPSSHECFHWKSGGMVVVREGKWKLVMSSKGDPELYDIPADPGEAKNLAGDQAERVARLQKLRRDYWKKVGAGK